MGRAFLFLCALYASFAAFIAEAACFDSRHSALAVEILQMPNMRAWVKQAIYDQIDANVTPDQRDLIRFAPIWALRFVIHSQLERQCNKLLKAEKAGKKIEKGATNYVLYVTSIIEREARQHRLDPARVLAAVFINVVDESL